MWVIAQLQAEVSIHLGLSMGSARVPAIVAGSPDRARSRDELGGAGRSINVVSVLVPWPPFDWVRGCPRNRVHAGRGQRRSRRNRQSQTFDTNQIPTVPVRINYDLDRFGVRTVDQAQSQVR
jgi:hypothetical protein